VLYLTRPCLFLASLNIKTTVVVYYMHSLHDKPSNWFASDFRRFRREFNVLQRSQSEYDVWCQH